MHHPHLRVKQLTLRSTSTACGMKIIQGVLERTKVPEVLWKVPWRRGLQRGNPRATTTRASVRTTGPCSLAPQLASCAVVRRIITRLLVVWISAFHSQVLVMGFFNIKTIFPSILISIIQIKRSTNRLIFAMEIPILLITIVHLIFIMETFNKTASL